MKDLPLGRTLDYALLTVDDVLVHFIRHPDVEKSFSLSKLAVTYPKATHWSGRRIRLELRTTAFKLWSSHSLRCKSVILYSETPNPTFGLVTKKAFLPLNGLML